MSLEQMPQHENRWVERHPFVARSLVLVSLMLGLDAASGVAYRAATGHTFFDRDATRARAEFEEGERRYRVRSPLYHHDLAPMRSLDDVWWGPNRYTVHTNSLGFRDRHAREVDVHAEHPRMMFIGDSFTEGVGYDWERTFVGLVDAALPHVEVLNAGVVSYSPSIYSRKVRYLLDDVGLNIDEVVVFIDISDAMDEARMYYRTPDARIESRPDSVRNARVPSDAGDDGALALIRRLIRDNTIVSATLVKLRRAILHRSGDVEPSIIVGERGLWTVDTTIYRAYGEEGLGLMTRAMNRLDSLVQRHDVELTVVVYPWPAQIVNNDHDSRHVRHWREWCVERDVRFIDLFPAFIPPGATATPEETVRQYYVDSDVHWNEAGHRLVAQAFLEQYGLITAPAPPGNGVPVP